MERMDHREITTYGEAVEYLLSIPRFTTKHTLEATREHLHVLGDPDEKLRIIHVAGTNGKGSVCAYMRSVLEAAGLRVCVFTSPHLVDIRERFLLGGEMVSREAFLRAFGQVYDSLDWEALRRGEGYHPTFFEYLFFMAVLLFAEDRPDFCILETGLGGRLDATNAVRRKELAVITRISLDHVEYLGDTVAKITEEKAGILQSGVPAVCVDSGADSRKILEGKARKMQSPLYFLSKKDYAFLNFHKKNIDFSLHTEYDDYDRLTVGTHALYQMENASLAVLALRVLDGAENLSIPAAAIRQGLAKCVWQGRMEEILPGVYVDGAHNADGIRAFLDSVGSEKREGRRSLLFSVVQDKDYPQMIKDILVEGLFDRIAIVQMKTARAVQTDVLRAIFEEKGKNVSQFTYTLYENVEDALRELLATREERECIYIAGSLYLVGEVKELLQRRRTEQSEEF